MDADEKRKASDKVAKNREYAERRGKKKAKTSKVTLFSIFYLIFNTKNICIINN